MNEALDTSITLIMNIREQERLIVE